MPAVAAQEEDVGDDDGAEVESATSGIAEPSPAADAVSPPSTDATNNNAAVEKQSATETE